ncbi:hypothetical protein [Mycobacterium intracellulare]|uniref:hypothetical protein n=1 Tax=Mycobacterium intracellulare TaxID=1767 RepID=UPI001915687A|nr:hypothetical protein [Mycobacterium intracellulare]
MQQRAKRRRRTVVALGATAVAGGALGYSQARSPRSYTRTAAARHHYAREHAKMHYNLAQNAYAQTAKSKINRGQPVAPFPIKTTRRSTRKNARIAAAAYFPKGAVHKPKNMMRATKANVKVHKARVKAQKIRKRSPRRKGKR